MARTSPRPRSDSRISGGDDLTSLRGVRKPIHNSPQVLSSVPGLRDCRATDSQFSRCLLLGRTRSEEYRQAFVIHPARSPGRSVFESNLNPSPLGHHQNSPLLASEREPWAAQTHARQPMAQNHTHSPLLMENEAGSSHVQTPISGLYVSSAYLDPYEKAIQKRILRASDSSRIQALAILESKRSFNSRRRF